METLHRFPSRTGPAGARPAARIGAARAAGGRADPLIAGRPHPRARLEIIVPSADAESIRRALFSRLFGHIKQLVVARGRENDARVATAILQVVVDRESIDEALQVVLALAGKPCPVHVPA